MEPFGAAAENDLVDLVKSKAGDLDGGVGQDQLLELDLERLEAPVARFAEAIDRQSSRANSVAPSPTVQAASVKGRQHSHRARAERLLSVSAEKSDSPWPSREDLSRGCLAALVPGLR
jgi:hypothetical protein